MNFIPEMLLNIVIIISPGKFERKKRWNYSNFARDLKLRSKWAKSA
jgi:hypothetical protein